MSSDKLRFSMEERLPSNCELATEKTILLGIVYDLVSLLVCGGIGVWSDSLTMIADMARGAILVGFTALSLTTLRRINRGRFSLYDYGTGKLEQMFSLIVSLELACAAAGFAFKAFERAGSDPGAADGSALALAAAAAATLDFVCNAWQYALIVKVARGNVSPIVRSEVAARRVDLITALVVVVAVATSSVASERLSVWADTLGTLFVAAYMVKTAYGILKSALPDLLDRTLDEDMQVMINRRLADHFDDYDAFIRVRSRRTGSVVLIELELGFAASTTMGAIQPVVDALRDGIEADITNARATVIPRSLADITS